MLNSISVDKQELGHYIRIILSLDGDSFRACVAIPVGAPDERIVIELRKLADLIEERSLGRNRVENLKLTD